MVDNVYRMDVAVHERDVSDGVVKCVYENTFWFKSVGMRKTCADRIRSLPGVTVAFSHEVEHAPQVVKRMVQKRKYKPFN